MFVEPPAKRLRLMGLAPLAGARGYDEGEEDDDFDELLYEPDEVTERRDPDYQLTKRRIAANNRFQSAMADIIEKFDRDFGETGDEIDFATGEVVVDRGHLSSLQLWDRSDEEEGIGAVDDEGEDDEDEGVRLEDLPDDWGEEGAVQSRQGHAPGTSVQATSTASPTEDTQSESREHQMASPVTHRFEIVLPRKQPLAGYKWPDMDHGDATYLAVNQEEYDSGFVSSSSERRRSGRVRKQVDFLGKITWDEALGLGSTSAVITKEPCQALPQRHITPPLTDNDDAARASGDGGIADSGVGGTSTHSQAGTITDSQQTAALASRPVSQRIPSSEEAVELEVADSDAESDTYLDTFEDHAAAGLLSPRDGKIRHDVEDSDPARTGTAAATASGNLTIPPIDAISEELEDASSQSAPGDVRLTTTDISQPKERASRSACDSSSLEIPDSQEPDSSPIQDVAGTQVETRSAEAQEPEPLPVQEPVDIHAESRIAASVPPCPVKQFGALPPPPAADTSKQTKKPTVLQQTTPQPSPSRKHATPSTHRPSPQHPRTPKHSIVSPTKPPSSRRSLLSLLSSSKKRKTSDEYSDSEDELIRDGPDQAISIPQLFASSRSRKRHPDVEKARAVDIALLRTPVKSRMDRRPMTPLSTGKACGQGDARCGSSFCFTCT